MKKVGDTLSLPGDPATAFEEFEQLLVSNSGEDAFHVAVQLLTAKLFDEHQTRMGESRSRFTLDGTPRAVHDRISALYQEAVANWPDLRTGKMTIDIAPGHLVRSLQPLVGWRISDSDLSHLDAVIERLVARDSKGSLGQYFTPRDVVRMCVTALHPTGQDLIIDPACGSGAFLYEAIRQSNASGAGSPRCLGIDLSQRAVHVALLLSHAVDPGALFVHKGNSLDGRDYGKVAPPGWNDFLIPCPEDRGDERRWGVWHDLQSTLLLTNPPFAGEIDDPTIIAAYDSQRGRGATRQGSVGREHLFIERAIDLLAPGGRLAIVVPQGILANSTASYLRKWVLSRCRVLAVVGLHPFAFLPYTSVKTSVLFLEKARANESLAARYEIAFATNRISGKDRSGRVIGKGDYAGIGAALAQFFTSQRLSWAVGADTSLADGVLEIVESDEVLLHDRLDAEYYGHDIRAIFRNVTSKATSRLGDHVARSVGRFNRSSADEIDYIDISSVETRSGIPVPSKVDAVEAPSRATYVVQAGDVLVSTVRPDRNVVALVTKTAEVPTVASNGFCVLRPELVPPELIFAFCKTATFRALLARRATASMYPAASDRDVLDIPFVEPRPSVAHSIVAKIKSGLEMMDAARELIAQAIEEMELALETAKETTHSEFGQEKHAYAKARSQGDRDAVPQANLPGLEAREVPR